MNSILHLSVLPRLSAIYYALLRCGYQPAGEGKDAATVAAVNGFCGGPCTFSPAFWQDVRQASCQVYPYWPRAALLETASFFLDDALAWRDRQRLHQQVMTAGNLLDSERDEVFWVWLEGFPQALADVLQDDGFRRYLAWEESRLPCLRQELAGEWLKTDHVLFRCRQAYALPLESVCAVINPIKRAGATDYHLQSGTLYCTSGCFRAESIIHECLHLAVHPHMDSLREQALAHQEPWPDVDASYYLAGSEDGWMNAFEEYAVRCLTDRVMAGQTPVLQQFLAELAKPTAV